MTEKTCPLDRDQLEALAEHYPTPFHFYDEKGIRENARRVRAAFANLEPQECGRAAARLSSGVEELLEFARKGKGGELPL